MLQVLEPEMKLNSVQCQSLVLLWYAVDYQVGDEACTGPSDIRTLQTRDSDLKQGSFLEQ